MAGTVDGQMPRKTSDFFRFCQESSDFPGSVSTANFDNVALIKSPSIRHPICVCLTCGPSMGKRLSGLAHTEA